MELADTDNRPFAVGAIVDGKVRLFGSRWSILYEELMLAAGIVCRDYIVMVAQGFFGDVELCKSHR